MLRNIFGLLVILLLVCDIGINSIHLVSAWTGPSANPPNANASPTQLALWTSTSSNGIYYNSGNVGIGTMGPLQQLDTGTGMMKGWGNELAATGAYIGFNTYWNSSWLYRNTDSAYYIRHNGSNLGISVAPSGTAGATANFTQALAITNTGNVGIGMTSAANKLDVNGSLAVGSYAGTATGASNELIVSGNVGIGTTNPSYALDVAGQIHTNTSSGNGLIMNTATSTNWNQIYYQTGGTTYWQLGNNPGNTFNLWDNIGGRPVFNAPSNGNLSIMPAGGSVGIGSYNTTANSLGFTGWGNPQLAIYSNGNDGIDLRSDQGNNLLNLWHHGTGSVGLISFNSGASTPSGVGSITTNGSTVAYNTTSDRRLKENIASTTSGLSTLLKIPVYDFNFIADPSKTRMQGFIAQELYKTYPEAVTVGGDDPIKQPWAVDYGRLTPLLVQSLQDEDAKVTTLQSQNAELKTEIEELKSEFETYKATH